MTGLALVMASPQAFADNHGDKEHKGHKGKMFEKHDTNSDGVISKDEFMGHAAEKFGKMDADGNGEITKEESKAAWEARKAKWKEKREERKAKQEDSTTSE